MNGFVNLFKLSFRKRMKDSFIISYGIIFPLVLIAVLGYMASNYFPSDGQVTSYYYYGMVLIPFCTVLGAITLIYVAREESNAKCGERFIIAPIGKIAIVMCKIIPSTIAMGFYNIILMGILKFIFKVDYNGEFFIIYSMIFVLGFMSCAMGTFIGLSTKNFMTVKNFVSTPILIMGMLGGAFFQVGSLGKGFEYLSYLSPLAWVNKGIFRLINDNNGEMFLIAMIFIMSLGILFTFGAVKKFRKEAFI